MNKNAFLFLNGYYPEGDQSLAAKLIRRSTPKPLIIAVDGGLAFLQRIGCKPAYWLTDLDSAPHVKRGFLNRTRLLIYPPHKDKTDGELAIELALQHRISNFTVFGWHDKADETDHLLGNLLLGCRFLKSNPSIRIRYVNDNQEMLLLHNETRTMAGYEGLLFSVIPLSSRIMLSLHGTEYIAKRLLIWQGQTIALRNRFTANKAHIEVGGTALILIRRQPR